MQTGNFRNSRNTSTSTLCHVSEPEFIPVTHTLTDTAYSLSLSRPVSHTITPVRRGDNLAAGWRERRGSIMGNVSRHMSKVQPMSWKSCVWCDSGPPAASPASPPPPTPTLSSWHKSFLCKPGGRKRARESRRRASREGHQYYSARINAFPLAVSPRCTAIVLRKSEKGFCVSVCVTEKQSMRE